MDKLLALLFSGSAALALSACDPTDKQAPAPAESLVPLPSAQPAPPAPTSLPATPAAAPSAAGPAEDECGAGKLGRYVGALPTTDVLDKVRAAIGHERIRAIKPGEAVTQDMRPDRLNIEIGEDGRIKRFRCY